MKAILEFNLPEDQSDFTVASNARKYIATLSAVDNRLRDCIKYGHGFATVMDALEDIRTFLLTEM